MTDPSKRPVARSIGDIVGRVIKTLGGKGRLTAEEMARTWQDAVGEDAARHSRPVSFRRTSIIVNVDRSSWLYELTTRKREIVEKLKLNLGGRKIRDIRFRIGDVSVPPEAEAEKKREERRI